MTNMKLDAFLLANPGQSINRYLHSFSLDELTGFISLMLLTGVFRAKREPIGELFNDDLNFGRPIFRAAMPRERMKNILRFLRFDNHVTRDVRVIQDKLAPIRDVFEEVNNALKCAYRPGKFVTIDEHLS